MHEGFLLVDKPVGLTSFDVVHLIRKKIMKMQIHLEAKPARWRPKVGHAGTLDPCASGLLIVLVGRTYTRKAALFTGEEKQYSARLTLGEERDSFDIDGKPIAFSKVVPRQEEVEAAISSYQGKIEQTPPMFSAKKVGGKRLYEIARKGKEVERKTSEVFVKAEFLGYSYPTLEVRLTCSKGTYVRAWAHELGLRLSSYAYVSALRRERSGRFHIEEAIPLQKIIEEGIDPSSFLRNDDDYHEPFSSK
jgi:tRNA pseudouridine55 synthase